MRIFTILSLIVLISGVFCVQEAQQGKLMAKNFSDKMQKSHLGKAILGLLQIQTGASGSPDLTKLYSAIALLKENLLQKKDDENIDFQNDGNAHDLQVSETNQRIAELKGEIVNYEGQLDALKAAERSLKQDLLSQQGQLQTAKDGKDYEIQYLETIKIKFDEDVVSFQEAIDLLGSAISKLNEAASHRNQAGFASSFIQTNKQDLVQLADLLSKKLTALKAKSTFVQPIVAFFAQLTSDSEEPDAQSLQRAITALSDLQQFYTRGLVQLQHNFEQETEQHNTLLTNLKNQISSLENVIIPKTEQEIGANSEEQNTKEIALSDAKTNLRQKEQFLTELDDSWNQRIEIHQLLIPELEKEYDIVVEAEQMLRRNFGL